MPKARRARVLNVFFDTVTLSNFALAGCLDLLVQRYGRRLHITPEVLDEILDGIAAGHHVLRAIEERLNRGGFASAKPLAAAERKPYRDLLRILGPGEASCIACATARGGVVATDDRVARECCGERGIRVTGTIGVLKACCRDGALSAEEADTILRKMIDAGYRSPVERISAIL